MDWHQKRCSYAAKKVWNITSVFQHIQKTKQDIKCNLKKKKKVPNKTPKSEFIKQKLFSKSPENISKII